MTDLINVLIWSLVLCQGTMTLTWFIARRLDNYSIVDITWTLNFAFLAILLRFLGTASSIQHLFLFPVLWWSIRLGGHLWNRISTHLDREDGRYITLRKEYGENLAWRFYLFFTLQALSNVLLAAPFIALAFNTQKEAHPIQYAGFFIWLIGSVGAGKADKQLKAFKEDPGNKGKVCQVGLWSWSRHPNYFFECITWIGFCLISYGSPYWGLGLISPIIITYLILNVTGVPLNEQQNLLSKGDVYRAYQETTSTFFPRPPKRRKPEL